LRGRCLQVPGRPPADGLLPAPRGLQAALPQLGEKLTFLGLKLTFLSLKLTFLGLKLSFLSLKLTFLSSQFSPRQYRQVNGGVRRPLPPPLTGARQRGR
jgi:hypothetical protein